MNPQDRLQVIEGWMARVGQDGGIERCDDLHIDAIDPEWAVRSLWSEASRWAFQAAVEVGDRLRLPFTLGLGMSLRSDELWRDEGVELTRLVYQVN